MAPVPLEPEVSYVPLILAATHATSVLYFTAVIAVSLYRSYHELGPSQDTRLRSLWRSKLLPTFGGLAALSLLLAGYSGWSYVTLSYKTWAVTRGVEVPDQLFQRSPGDGNQTVREVYLARWLSDTPVYIDAYEILVEKARRFWWGQQLDLAAASWTMLLAIEGRRRGISFLWAYALLAQSVSLSFAQNLFYIAILLTPVPIVRDSQPYTSRLSRLMSQMCPPKPNNWVPHPVLFFGLLFASYGTIFMLPGAVGSSSFATLVVVSKVLPLALIILPAIVPERWGTTYEHPHDAYDGYTMVFQFASLMSALLFGKSTISAICYSLPDSYRHRHSIRIPFDTEERSKWERTTSAVGKVLGSTSDHPLVAAAGRDVLLSAFSLGIWAAVRAIDVNNMLKSGVPFYEIATAAMESDASSVTTRSDIHIKEESPELASGAVQRRRALQSKRINHSNNEDTLVNSTRRRVRSRKIKPDPEEAPGDRTYEPSPEEKALVVEGDVIPDEDGLDWEAASLAWGLSIVGGLGAGSAAVFGAECISR